MTNKRGANMLFFGGFMYKGLFRVLTRLAKRERAKDQFTFVMMLVKEALARRDIVVAEPKLSVHQGGAPT